MCPKWRAHLRIGLRLSLQGQGPRRGRPCDRQSDRGAQAQQVALDTKSRDDALRSEGEGEGGCEVARNARSHNQEIGEQLAAGYPVYTVLLILVRNRF